MVKMYKKSDIIHKVLILGHLSDAHPTMSNDCTGGPTVLGDPAIVIPNTNESNTSFDVTLLAC